MESAYIDFARSKANQSKNLSDEIFTALCATHVSQKQYNINAHAIICAVACHFEPMYRVFTGDVLISNQMLPTQNLSEAFEFVKNLGATPDEMALTKEDDGKINFGLSLAGLKLCANYCQPVKDVLSHASWILTALELYIANK